MFPDDTPKTEIPYGYCQCGCGRKTKTSKRNDITRGYVAGQPRRYLRGHQGRQPTVERFWKKVDKSPHPKGCWLWKASVNKKGYGIIGWEGTSRLAHRVAYLLAHGEYPNELFVLHSCDTPACCNPEHLFLGTQQDNMDDKISKGRHNPGHGERHGFAKLTKEQVIEIRERGRTGKWGIQTQLAKEFSITSGHVSNIVHGIWWKE